jgi:ATP-dependent Clp protease adapter protein ClpS
LLLFFNIQQHQHSIILDPFSVLAFIQNRNNPLKYSNIMMKLTLLAVLLSVLQLGAAFSPAAFGVRHHQHTALFAGGEEGEGSSSAAIAKPKIKTDQATKTVQKSQQKQKQKAELFDPISRRDEDFEDAPMFKLMLLGDESYDASHVIERLCAIVDDMDEDQAKTVLQQATSGGKAMCGKYPFERAELFKEQLIRSTPMIYADMVEDKN